MESTRGEQRPRDIIDERDSADKKEVEAREQNPSVELKEDYYSFL